MPNRRALLAACLLAGVLLAPGARAGEIRPFDEAAFDAARRAGAPVLVEVSAPWCPICKTQRPILARLAADPRFAALQVFDVDFDSRKDVLRRLDARSQSTLIVYKGGQEVGRSVGETQPEWIEALLEKTL